MPSLFHDRRDAGRRLGARLAPRRYADPIVLGLPRGGVPVAYEVALALRAPLDVFVVRKLGAPGHPELAMGAVATGGVRVLMDDVIAELGVSADVLAATTSIERAELERRERAYRSGRPPLALERHTAILVDDGVATGASMVAAIQAARVLRPRLIVAAAPVMSERARQTILTEADACEAVAIPEPFFGVGVWYEDFAQTSDEEVRALLSAARDRDVGGTNSAAVLPASPANTDAHRTGFTSTEGNHARHHT
jgi:putative phosphoribosyl transferase